MTCPGRPRRRKKKNMQFVEDLLLCVDRREDEGEERRRNRERRMKRNKKEIRFQQSFSFFGWNAPASMPFVPKHEGRDTKRTRNA